MFGEFQWVEIIYAFFGSFVGFLLALLTDNYIAKREEKSKIKTVLEAIEAELGNTALVLGDSDGDEDELTFVSTFVWRSVTNSDFFPTLLHEENEKCSLLIQIYTELDALTHLQEKYSGLATEKATLIAEILKGIEAFKNMMKKEK